MQIIDIPLSDVTDDASFHAVCRQILGFPDFYGDNMNAWVDCLRDADKPETGMMKVSVTPGDLLFLKLNGLQAFEERCPQLCAAIFRCASFINECRTERDQPALLAVIPN